MGKDHHHIVSRWLHRSAIEQRKKASTKQRYIIHTPRIKMFKESLKKRTSILETVLCKYWVKCCCVAKDTEAWWLQALTCGHTVRQTGYMTTTIPKIRHIEHIFPCWWTNGWGGGCLFYPITHSILPPTEVTEQPSTWCSSASAS